MIAAGGRRQIAELRDDAGELTTIARGGRIGFVREVSVAAHQIEDDGPRGRCEWKTAVEIFQLKTTLAVHYTKLAVFEDSAERFAEKWEQDFILESIGGWPPFDVEEFGE